MPADIQLAHINYFDWLSKTIDTLIHKYDKEIVIRIHPKSNKKEHKTDLHSVLNVLHQPHWLPEHYNVILIDLTCSPIADHNNRLYDSQDRISRTTVRDIIKNTSSHIVTDSINK